MEESSFNVAFDDFVRRLAIECNWHEHTPTCFKLLRPGEEPSDENCRMRIDGSVRAQSYVNSETQSILLRRHHPHINNYNDIVLFLYISDYIMKNDLQVHVGLQAILAAIESHRRRFENSQCCDGQT